MQIARRRPSEAAPRRMGALAKLPVFLDFAGKRVVVAGGSAPAAWKAELLAAAGAHVEVIAAETGADMAALLERGAAAGRLSLTSRAWVAADLAGAALALADAGDDAEAHAFHAAAVAAGVPVNVIDRPACCQFQFGSIVNRSPVVVAISTDGAAPILAQAIRRRIETLLPSALSAWAGLAKDIRQRVGERFAPGQGRRAFWERFAERAFGPPPADQDARDPDGLIDRLSAGSTAPSGRVTLVGAGPGDAELLTLKAVRAMQSADVILFDDLVSEDVLELARREAKRMLVGKRGKRASCAQDDINALMISLARQGRHVVRLKSGDPMVFGRAGEEIAVLEAAGIAVTVVPGITAGVALAASLGVSLTHRELAQSVRFVTGHSRHGELPDDLDWRGLADPATTLVFYMGGRTAPAIAERLMAHGLPATTPAVVAAGVGRADGWTWRGDLAGLSARSPPSSELPVLIAIGRSLALAAGTGAIAPVTTAATAEQANCPSPSLVAAAG